MSPHQKNRPADHAASDFENRLATVPLRPAPAELRTRVFRSIPTPNPAAGEAAYSRPPHPTMASRTRLFVASLVGFLRCRFSFAGGALPVCWLAIGVLATVDRILDWASTSPALQTSVEQASVARSQRERLLQFVGVEPNLLTPHRPGSSPKPVPTPRPRGDWREADRDYLVQDSNPCIGRPLPLPLAVVTPYPGRAPQPRFLHPVQTPPHPAPSLT